MLRFQPMRRPQPGQKPKPKGAFLKIGAITAPATTTPAAATATPTVASSTSADPSAASAPVQQPPRSKLADWAATEDDEYAYGLGKRHRGGRKAKKKNNRDDTDRETDWDELYDPARPTNVEEYLRSDERIAEIREWKGVLYAHRRRREQNRIRPRSRGSRGSSSGSEARAPHTSRQIPRDFPFPLFQTWLTTNFLPQTSLLPRRNIPLCLLNHHPLASKNSRL